MHCLSRRRVHASRPHRRAAQSTRRSRATKRARLLFGYFFLARQEKVRSPVSGENQQQLRRKTFSLAEAEPPLSVAERLVSFSEPPGSAPDARAGVSDAPFSAADRRAYFLLLRQKKVAKEKATPAYAVGFADSPALLKGPGGCGTRGYAPQTVLADYPRPFSAARRFRWGPGTASQLLGSAFDLARSQFVCLSLFESDAFPSPSASSSSAGGAGVSACIV